MNFSQKLGHFAPRNFGIPVINSREESEDGSGRNDIMEMADHVIGVVQMNVRGRKSERQAGESPDSEHRQKREREKHRRIEADRAAPQTQDQRRQNNHRRNRNNHGRNLKKSTHLRAHPYK